MSDCDHIVGFYNDEATGGWLQRTSDYEWKICGKPTTPFDYCPKCGQRLTPEPPRVERHGIGCPSCIDVTTTEFWKTGVKEWECGLVCPHELRLRPKP